MRGFGVSEVFGGFGRAVGVGWGRSAQSSFGGGLPVWRRDRHVRRALPGAAALVGGSLIARVWELHGAFVAKHSR